MGCHFWNNCNDCTKNTDKKEDFKEYTILRRLDRIKLHAKYISCISLGIVVWLIATGTYDNSYFPEWVSFASTITSIILSVVAIILSITGESKTDAIKTDLSETAKKLDNVTDRIDKEMFGANQETKELIKELERQIAILQDKVDKVPEQVNQYTKNSVSQSNYENREVNNRDDWGKRV